MNNNMGIIYYGSHAIAEVDKDGRIYDLPEKHYKGAVTSNGQIYIKGVEVGHVSFDGSIYNDKEEKPDYRVARVEGNSVYNGSYYTTVYGENCTSMQIGAAYYLLFHGAKTDIRTESDMKKYMFRDLPIAFVLGGLLGLLTTGKLMISLLMGVLFMLAAFPFPGLTKVDLSYINMKTNPAAFKSATMKSMIRSGSKREDKVRRILSTIVRMGLVIAAMALGYVNSDSGLLAGLIVFGILFMMYGVLKEIHKLLPWVVYSAICIVCYFIFHMSTFLFFAACGVGLCVFWAKQ